MSRGIKNSGQQVGGGFECPGGLSAMEIPIPERKIRKVYSLGGIIPGDHYMSFFGFFPEFLRAGGEEWCGISYIIKYYRVLGNFRKKNFLKIFNPQNLSQLLPSGLIAGVRIWGPPFFICSLIRAPQYLINKS